MRDNPSVQHSHAPKHLETNDDPGEQHSHDPEQQDQVAKSYCEDPGEQFSDAPEHLETNDSNELEISRNGLHQVSTVNMSTKPILRNELKTPLYLGSTHNRNRRKHER